MCGFTGIIDFEKITNLETNLKQSIDVIKHRGPDNQGVFVDKENGIYLGFNRLKIIDLLDQSNQPFKSEDDQIILAFNGEIYNYKTLREELKNDYQFKTESDTEVLLCCYQKWGIDFLEKIEGMFSICIFNKKENKILLIRDRLGIKPLFYSINKNQIIFTSEIKSILKSGLVQKEINPTAIDSYLTFLCTIDNQTPFKDILKLRPGEFISISLKDKNIYQKYYWDLQKSNNLDNTESDIIKNTLGKLDQSIAEQMQSDVDFGCFLSGGLDSSINAILMSQKMGFPVKTLSVYFDNEKYNEIEYSRLISNKLNAEKFEKKIEQKDFWEFMDKFGAINDNLNGDLVCFPLYFLSELTNKNNIKMIQVGEGADEIFCGYRSFRYQKVFKILDNMWNKTSKWNTYIKKVLIYPLKLILNKDSFIYETLARWENNLPWYSGANNIFNTYEKTKIFDSSFRKHIDNTFIGSMIKKYYKPELSPLQKITYFETKLRLPELLLNRVDMLTMNFSIEARVPFLNSKLVEYIFNICDELKLKNNTTKYLLKKSVEGIVPDEIINRPKQGFWAPFLDWYINDKDFNSKIKNIIIESKLLKDNILDKKYIEKILNTGKFNERTILKVWSILILTNFYDYYFKTTN